MPTHNCLQHVHVVNGHSGHELVLLDTFGSTAPLGPHQPSSLRPHLPRPLRRQLILTVLLHHYFHPPPSLLLLLLLLPTPAPPPPLLTRLTRTQSRHNNKQEHHHHHHHHHRRHRGEDLDYTCPHCDRTFTSHIGLVGHQSLFEHCPVCPHCQQQLCDLCFKEHVDEFHTMFRIICNILQNETDQLKEIRENLVSRRKNAERQRMKLYKDIDGAFNDLLSACRTAFLRAEGRLDQLQAQSKAELSTVLDNRKLMELAVNLLQVAKNPAQKEDIPSLCKLRELAMDAEETLGIVGSPEFGNDPPAFENFTLTNSLQTIGVNLRNLNLLTHHGSAVAAAAAAAAATATTANVHLEGSSTHQRSTVLEPATNPKASSRMAGVGNQQFTNTQPPPPPTPKYKHDDCEQMVLSQPEPLQHQQQQQQNQEEEEEDDDDDDDDDDEEEEEESQQPRHHQQSEQHRKDLHNNQTVDKTPRDLELYVDGLSAGITAENLKTHFERFGEVLDVDMSTDSSTDDDSRTGAYITLRTTADPSQILETEHILCGVPINVEECESCDDSENDSVCEAQSNTTECADQPGSAVEIYVDGVKAKTTAEKLRTYFAQFGEVVDVSLFMHSSTNRPCGGGYITLRPTCDVATILRTEHTVCGSRINAREPVLGGKRPNPAARMAGVGNQQFANTKAPPPPPPPKYQFEDCEQMVLSQPEPLQHQQQQHQQQQNQQEEQEQQPQQSRQHQQSEQHRNDSHNYQTVDKSPRDLELYVDGLSADITAETLKTHFDRFGEVLDVDMSTDSSTDDDSRNGAYITLRTTADPSHILETEHILCGVPINVEECESCDDSENDSVCEAQSNTTECADQPGSAVEIYVDGVKAKTTAEKLRTYFAQFGEVVDVSLFMHSSTNRPCGGGYITLRPTCDVATILRTEHTVCGSRINAREPVLGGKRPNPAARMAGVGNQQFANTKAPPPPPPPKYQFEDCEQMVLSQPEPLQHQQQQHQQQQNQQEEQEQQPQQSRQHQQSEQHRNDSHNYQTVDKSPRDLELYVDGLSADITAETLKTHFDRFGEVLDVDMSTDSSTDDDSRNGAYITLRTTADPSHILETEHILCGVPINVEECESCDDSENDSVCYQYSTLCNPQEKQDTRTLTSVLDSSNVFIFGMRPHMNIEGLISYFSKYGRLINIYLALSPSHNNVLGFGFLVFAEEADVRQLSLKTWHNINCAFVEVRKYEQSYWDSRVKQDFELVPLLAEDSLKTMRQNVSGPTSTTQAQQLPKQKAGILSDARSIAADGAKQSKGAVELYVDGVKADTTAETLRTYFSQFGEVLDVSTDCGSGLITLRPKFDVATIVHTKHSINGDRINAREPADGDKQKKDAGRDAVSPSTGDSATGGDVVTRTPALCSHEKGGPASAVGTTENNSPLQSGVEKMEGTTDNTVAYASPVARKVAVRPDLYTIEEVSEEEEKAEELSLDEIFEDSEMEGGGNNFSDTAQKQSQPDTNMSPKRRCSDVDDNGKPAAEMAIRQPTRTDSATRRRQRRSWNVVS
ncbi:hypothetical protein SprV_0200957900 [Sparganum proliferum]